MHPGREAGRFQLQGANPEVFQAAHAAHGLDHAHVEHLHAEVLRRRQVADGHVRVLFGAELGLLGAGLQTFGVSGVSKAQTQDQSCAGLGVSRVGLQAGLGLLFELSELAGPMQQLELSVLEDGCLGAAQRGAQGQGGQDGGDQTGAASVGRFHGQLAFREDGCGSKPGAAGRLFLGCLPARTASQTSHAVPVLKHGGPRRVTLRTAWPALAPLVLARRHSSRQWRA